MSARSNLLNRWLHQLGYQNFTLASASEDASFRSYLRLEVSGESLIVMDAPPEHEPCDRFIAVAGMIRAAGLSAPEIIASNLNDGFLLLTDFGGEDYLSRLDANSQDALYTDAISALLAMQTGIEAASLPDYDEDLLLREMGLFHDWFLGELLGIQLDAKQQAAWQRIQCRLIENAVAQPQVFVHRDYHARYLMVLAKNNPGILDFQDAVRGPVSYDLVSLLRDCYVAWPPDQVEQLMQDYYNMALGKSLVDVSVAQFRQWFNLTGIQRHLKAVGIFSRLNIRDGKSRYLGDIPRTLGYIAQVSAVEESMAELAVLLQKLGLRRRFAALQGD